MKYSVNYVSLLQEIAVYDNIRVIAAFYCKLFVSSEFRYKNVTHPVVTLYLTFLILVSAFIPIEYSIRQHKSQKDLLIANKIHGWTRHCTFRFMVYIVIVVTRQQRPSQRLQTSRDILVSIARTTSNSPYNIRDVKLIKTNFSPTAWLINGNK